MKIALVHDYLTQYGGAERVLERLHALWPQAPIFTTFYDRPLMERLGLRISPRSVRPLMPASLPHGGMLGKAWSPLYPLVFRSLRLGDYDVAISSSSFAAHQARVGVGTRHICYCHSPPRFLYGLSTELDHERLRRRLPGLPWLYAGLRSLDRAGARGVDTYLANSAEVRERIRSFYARDALVVYPPVDVEAFAAEARSGTRTYFLCYGRWVASKRIDLAVRAATAGRLPLVVAGRGPEERRLRALAGPTVRFVDQPDRPALLQLLQGALAVVFAAHEDFGIVPVEAMAAGRPVIAFRAGGAVESIVDGVTGTFFAPQAEWALLEAMRAFRAEAFDPARCRLRARRFGGAAFDDAIRAIVGSG